MRISLKRDIRGLMTEPFSNQYWIRAEVDQRGCMGVPEIVDPDLLDTGTLYPDIECTPDIVQLLRE